MVESLCYFLLLRWHCSSAQLEGTGEYIYTGVHELLSGGCTDKDIV